MPDTKVSLVREEPVGDHGDFKLIQADMPVGPKFTGIEGVEFYLKRGWQLAEKYFAAIEAEAKKLAAEAEAKVRAAKAKAEQEAKAKAEREAKAKAAQSESAKEAGK